MLFKSKAGKTDKKTYELDRKPIFVVNRIVSKITGLNQAMFQRARLLSEYTNKPVDIVCFHFDPKHYSTLTDDLVSRGKISSDIRVTNMYEYLKGEDVKEIKTASKEDKSIYSIEKKGNSSRYFLNGRYIKYEKYDDRGMLERTDYYNDNRYNYKTEIHDQKGNLAREQFKDLITGEPRNEIYYRSDGTVYLSKWLKWDEKDKKTVVVRINLFDKENNLINVFHSDDQLKHYFLDHIVHSEPSAILAEARSVDRVVLNYKNKHVKTYAIVHNMHIESPFEDYTAIDKHHDYLLNNTDKLDGLVVLTEKQRNDIQQYISSNVSMYVIPHANSNTVYKDRNEVIDNRISVVARLVDQKQLEEAIKAIQIVVKSVPEVKLHIFGEGKNKSHLQDLINESGLAKNVLLEGFTEDALREYRKSTLSLLTSKYEGFGLVLLESLSQGCPTIAYDIKYGPSDIIENGKNGFLVENYNRQEMARKIIEVLQDKGLQKRLNAGAIKSIDRFTEKEYLDNWVRLLNQD
jgi:glycosyltransferase involved in cell wall biosynthesis